jgi:hypothetical protein
MATLLSQLSKLSGPVLMGALLSACAASQSGPAASCGNDRLCQTNQNIYIDKAGVNEASSSSSSGSVGAMGLLDPILSLTPVLTLKATLAPPSIGGAQLQASDITVNGTKIYVSYNTAGAVQAGGIDVIDVASATAPVLKSEALYPSADIHKVTIDGTNLYAVGAASGVGEGAMIYKIALDAGGLLTSTRSERNLRRAADSEAAYAGIGVKVNGNNVYAVSGNNGGLSILNKNDLSDVFFTPIENARDLSLGVGGDLFVVTGKTATDEARVKRFTSTGATVVSTNVALANAQVDDGKSAVVSGSRFLIASAGFGGAKLVCVADGTAAYGTLFGTMTNPAQSGLAASLQVANAVAFGNGLVYVANGEAGVSIYSLERTLVTSDCSGHSLQYRGRFTFGAGQSVNNVFWSNGYLVVATGKGGFNIVQVTQSLVAGLLQTL